VIYLIGAYTIDLLDNDATQYFTIAMNMYESGNYLDVSWRPDYDYLDKPPLLFWLSAFSFSIFGLNHFAYRLPSILIHILGIFSTYKLGKRLYNKQVGLFSSIIYAANFAVFVINHDVRTDTLLTGFVIFSIWQLYEYLVTKNKVSFILAFIGIGLGISAKGPLGLLIPILSIGPYLIYKRKWKDIFRPEWLLGLLIIFITLIPMIYSVYQQHGMGGIRFHFWDQSFGRITGNTKWEDTTGPLFFIHSFLWSFLPWTILALIAYVKKWIGAFKAYGKNDHFEIITISGITLVFIAMSIAQYKLPHYVYVVFPLIAIITGDYIYSTFKQLKWEGFGPFLSISQTILNSMLWVAAFAAFYLFPVKYFATYLITAIFFAVFVYMFFKKKDHTPRIFSTTLITIIGVAFVMNLQFYPGLNPYQSGAVAGRDIKEMKIAPNDILIYKSHKPAMDVYAEMIVPRVFNQHQLDSVLAIRNLGYVFTCQNNLVELAEYDLDTKIIRSYDDFHTSTLSLPFLNPKIRAESLRKCYLLKIEY
jgi:4-amino-4-deoxy-L-arabinose transferase-like glycosyltransferase